MTKRILAIAAHPDDETIGCGGTLLRHFDSGDRVEWLIGTEPWAPLFDDAWTRKRNAEIDLVAASYGMARVHRLGFPTTKLDMIPIGDVISKMRDALSAACPDIVYVVHRGDVHSDHRVTFDAAWIALKPFRGGGGVQSIYSYETNSSTNMAPPTPDRVFLPQAFSDVTSTLDRKLAILSLYESEIQAPPGPRSTEALRGLARWRGSSVGMEYAEAFMVMRKTW